MTRHLALSLLWILCSCAGGASADADPDDAGVAASDAQSDDAMASCDPGQRVCVDEDAWATCEASREPGDASLCDPGTRCSDGHCRLPLCEPGERRCVSWTVHRSCAADGRRWEAPQACDTDEVCHDGACLTCFPDQPTCATFVASAICGEDGLSFPIDDIASCTAGENCHEPTGICLTPTCVPGETVCAGALGTHACLDSGTTLSPEITPCATGETCDGASCSGAACPPHPVLFVVDRTGAFDEDWEAYRSAIKASTEAHPSALYGFMPFPMAFGCPDPGAGELPRFPAEANADIDLWFDTVPKSAGEAALQHTLQTVLDRAHELFVGNGGRVVLISSGAADCGSDDAAIGAIVAALRVDHDVRTYVIGHRASQGLYKALDAAHAEGGSGWDNWQETSYDLDLKVAVEAALEDVPSCN